MGTIDAHGALHDNEGRYANQNKPSAGFDLDAQPTQPDVAWDTDPSATNQIKHYLAAETAVGGPESMTAAKTALWRTALWADAPDLYGDEDDEGFHECYLCGAESPAGEIDAHMRNDHPQYTSGLTAADIAPESKAKVEADFEAWAAENADAVKTFTETVGDPDGGDPAEFLAHNWWLTRNGHGTGFGDLLDDDPEYAEAVREAEDRKREVSALLQSLEEARIVVVAAQEAAAGKPTIHRAWDDVEKATRAEQKVGTEVLVAAKRVGAMNGRFVDPAVITPLDVLREKTTKQTTRYTIHSVNPHLRGTVEHQLDADSDEEALAEVTRYGDRATIWKREPVTYRDTVAENALVRAEALTALDKATPTIEYDVYIGDGGKVHVG